MWGLPIMPFGFYRKVKIMSRDEDFEEFVRRWFLPAIFGYPTLNSFLYKVREAKSISTEFIVGSIADNGPNHFMITVQHSQLSENYEVES